MSMYQKQDIMVYYSLYDIDILLMLFDFLYMLFYIDEALLVFKKGFMQKYIHPHLVRVYIRDNLGGLSFSYRGLFLRQEKSSYNVMLDLRGLSKTKN